MKIKSSEFYKFYFDSPDFWDDYYYEDVMFIIDSKETDDEIFYDDEIFKVHLKNSKFIEFDDDCGYVAKNSDFGENAKTISFKQFFMKWRKQQKTLNKTTMIIEVENESLNEVKMKLKEMGIKIL